MEVEVADDGWWEEFGVMWDVVFDEELLVAGVVVEPSAESIGVHACGLGELGFGVGGHSRFRGLGV